MVLVDCSAYLAFCVRVDFAPCARVSFDIQRVGENTVILIFYRHGGGGGGQRVVAADKVAKSALFELWSTNGILQCEGSAFLAVAAYFVYRNRPPPNPPFLFPLPLLPPLPPPRRKSAAVLAGSDSSSSGFGFDNA